MDPPTTTPCQELVNGIQQLNDFLIAKADGKPRDSLEEKELNDAIKTQIQFIYTHHDFLFITPSTREARTLRVNFWRLENMVSTWSDEKELNEQQCAELLSIKAQLEETEGWRVALSGAWNEEMELD